MVNEPDYISIKDMIAYMNSGKPFSIVYVTWDKAKGAGGSVKEVQLAYKNYAAARSESKSVNVVEAIANKNPNHFSNSTVNINIPGQGGVDIRKVHVQLIRRFNGAIVK